ncbi:MAG: hypothetical protein IT303_12470 [Dehalococcoidia bacterium]|nr:hypothetical protein [Dehalococcoidia bacterium]
MMELEPGQGNALHFPALRSKPQRMGRVANPARAAAVLPVLELPPPVRARSFGGQVLLRGFVLGLASWAFALFAVSFLPGSA